MSTLYTSIFHSLEKSLIFLLFINMIAASMLCASDKITRCNYSEVKSSPNSSDFILHMIKHVFKLSKKKIRLWDTFFMLPPGKEKDALSYKLLPSLKLYKNLPKKLQELATKRFQETSQSLLMLAISINLEKEVKILIEECKVDINYQSRTNGRTALIVACKKGYPDLAIYLLKHGSHAHYSTKYCINNIPFAGTALTFAFLDKSIEQMIQKLLLYALSKEERISDQPMNQKRIAWRKSQKTLLENSIGEPNIPTGLSSIVDQTLSLKVRIFSRIIPHMDHSNYSQTRAHMYKTLKSSRELASQLKLHELKYPRSGCSYDECKTKLFETGAKIKTCENCHGAYYCFKPERKRSIENPDKRKNVSKCQKRDWIGRHGVKSFIREAENSDRTLVRYVNHETKEYYNIPQEELVVKYPTHNHALSLCALLSVLNAYAAKNNR